MHSIIYSRQTDGFILLLSTQRSAVSASPGMAGVWQGGALALVCFCHHSLGCSFITQGYKTLLLQELAGQENISCSNASVLSKTICRAAMWAVCWTQGMLQPSHGKNDVTLAAVTSLHPFSCDDQAGCPAWHWQGFAGARGCLAENGISVLFTFVSVC